MAIRLYKSSYSLGAPHMDYLRAGNSMTVLAGDVIGVLSSSPIGTASRRATLTSGGGIWGIAASDLTTDSNGNVQSPAFSSTIDTAIQPILALPAYASRLSPAGTVAGTARRAQLDVYLADDSNIFIQRHKAGTRVNQSLVGIKCDLVYNAVTLEWEVDTGTTSSGMIVIEEVPPFYADNRTLYDSATFATDTYGAWLAFKVVPAWQGQPNGLRY